MRASGRRGPHQPSELAAVLGACRGALIGLGAFSGISNLLMLTGSLYMLEVYDRVLPGRSIPTLIGLSILVVLLFGIQGGIDLIRSRLLVRIGASLDNKLCARVFRSIVLLPLRAGAKSDGLQPLRDLDNLRTFLSGGGPVAFFDLPWMPFYLAICFGFHVWIGITALAGAIVLVTLTSLTEALTRRPIMAAAESAIARTRLAEAGRRNAEVLTAMGVARHLENRWIVLNGAYIASQAQASDVAGGLGAIVRVLRMMLQSAVLGVGAYLVIQQEASSGVIIAGSIIAGRALSPIDLAIANWKAFVAARQSWTRLEQLMRALPEPSAQLQLPAPRSQVTAENAGVSPAGEQKLVVQDVNFTLKSGTGLGVIGPSASGKSSLARMLVGVWGASRGAIRIDGAELSQWSSDELGGQIGYLPQDVELIDGTVAENIARFHPEARDEAIVKAAKAAQIHDLIVSLPQGYQTPVGDNGSMLSAGQQQRIALARALYGDPFLVVLDEPNSNLDTEGEEALTRAIVGVRERGGIVIVIAHRPSALSGVDLLLVMANGRQQAFGPKDEVLTKVLRRDSAPVTLKVASDASRAVR